MRKGVDMQTQAFYWSALATAPSWNLSGGLYYQQILHLLLLPLTKKISLVFNVNKPLKPIKIHQFWLLESTFVFIFYHKSRSHFRTLNYTLCGSFQLSRNKIENFVNWYDNCTSCIFQPKLQISSISLHFSESMFWLMSSSLLFWSRTHTLVILI